MTMMVFIIILLRSIFPALQNVCMQFLQLPEWQGRVEMVLNLNLFDWKCETMFIVRYQIEYWLVMTVITPENCKETFCKARKYFVGK